MVWLFLFVRGHAHMRWLAVVGGAFAAILVLKLVFGVDPALGRGFDIHSPSGHTASASAAYGGLAVLIFGAPAGIVVSILTAVVVGYSRLALDMHSVPEVIIGGAVGIAATILFAGRMPRLSPASATVLAALAALLLVIDHGNRAQIEPVLRHVEAHLRLSLEDLSGHHRPAALTGDSARRPTSGFA